MTIEEFCNEVERVVELDIQDSLRYTNFCYLNVSSMEIVLRNSESKISGYPHLMKARAELLIVLSHFFGYNDS